MKQLTLTDIWIYPIKSLGGIRLNTARVLPKGLEYDRRWMLVDDKGMFMTQRILSRMALFKLDIQDKTIFINFKGNTIQVSTDHDRLSQNEKVKIWDDTVSACEVSKEHSAWFSEMLDFKCKLISFPESNPRPVDPNFQVNNEHVSLADAFPFLIIGQQSLDDLNARLKEPIPMNRFRPNFVFSGGQPFEEDGWRNFTIGNNQFVGVKPCARCIVPTIDQETAVKNAEPLKTLATFRQRNNKIYFGQNLVAVDHGQVSVCDQILLG